MNYARYATIHARHLPEKICLIERTPSTHERRTLTWRQFNEAINRVANYLSTELGVGVVIMSCTSSTTAWSGSSPTMASLTGRGGAVELSVCRRGHPVCGRGVSAEGLHLGRRVLPVVQPLRQRLMTVQAYICTGTQVPEEMIDYATLGLTPRPPRPWWRWRISMTSP